MGGALIGERERKQFLDEGFLVLPGVVPRALCLPVIEAMETFLGLSYGNPGSWHAQPADGHGIVPLHHHPALWKLRQFPGLHEVFCTIYQQRELWVSLDRCSFKVPRPGRIDAPHWDQDPHAGQRLSVQGLVYLDDTPSELGAFVCYPEIYRRLDDWLASHPGERVPDVSGVAAQPLPGPQGSLVLWHRLMPHTSLANTGDRPRVVQYVAFERAGTEADRHRLAALVRGRMPPDWAVRQKIAHQVMPEPEQALDLSAHGKRIAGLSPWDPQSSTS